ncbi:hypothetical protein AAW12_08840 [Sphingobacterium sp. Ag1]|uniref:hypothetical protein n=1 Tax=Sphingobacterium sp. Ag1 TaxID=1643451 RepID=UPI000627B279|nr:hypothetical protein [Sphingobacterium sp. Ag1]KKO91757.1 hypothetical protein AAW12_08840 [Sphingobacterium sp. Ag1]
MNTEELGQLIELVISETMTLEEAASIERVDPRELSRVIDEVMTFRSRHSRSNEIVVRISDFKRLDNE